MVVTYLLILTGVVGYACWRGYQLEVWLGELSNSVGQLASDITKVDLRQTSESRVCCAMHDGAEQRLDGLDGEVESIDKRLAAVELQHDQMAAKKPAMTARDAYIEIAKAYSVAYEKTLKRKPRGKK